MPKKTVMQVPPESSITTYQRVLSYLDGGVEWAACQQDGKRHESLVAAFRTLVAHKVKLETEVQDALRDLFVLGGGSGS